MDSIIINNDSVKNDLYPLSSVRSIVDFRIGILTLREKWELAGYQVENDSSGTIPANIIPEIEIIEKFNKDHFRSIPSSARKIQYPWDICRINAEMIQVDFALITKGKTSYQISSTNKLISPENIFIEEGSVIEHCILNASRGPIYIGRNSEVMEGSIIRGPFALCENSSLKMGTKIYGGTTIGKNCVVGGEIKNSVISDFSNKAHDGYLGDSVIGQWCNIGAGTSNSNIKNTAGDVMVWNNSLQQFSNAGLKSGLIMGDYSRCSINTSFNTGTVVGVCCNIFGHGLTPKYIPDFSWGFDEAVYNIEKAIKDIDNWKKLKNQSITPDEIKMLKQTFEQSKHNNK
jgi:UDP-N-acetylglucosamine diphosphorylase/glucosamine-1-phosphate N-acetyltransferase